MGFSDAPARTTAAACAVPPFVHATSDPPPEVLRGVRTSAPVYPASECFQDGGFPGRHGHPDQGSRRGVVVRAGAVTWLSLHETRVEGGEVVHLLDGRGQTWPVVREGNSWRAGGAPAPCFWVS